MARVKQPMIRDRRLVWRLVYPYLLKFDSEIRVTTDSLHQDERTRCDERRGVCLSKWMPRRFNR